jgi:hypothetical protein
MKIYNIEQAWMISERGIEHGTNAYSALRLVDQKTGKFDQRYSESFFRKFSLSYSRNQSIAEVWRRPKVEGFKIKNLNFPDLTRIAGQPSVHAFSQSVINIFGSKLLSDGEILPFDMEGYEYSWFRVTQVLNVLKTDGSMGFTADPEYIPYLEKYDFHADRLEGIHLFHIVNHPGTFATNLFVDLVREHNLKGLTFQLIWDSENPDYVDERFKPEVWTEIKTRHAKRQIL